MTNKILKETFTIITSIIGNQESKVQRKLFKIYEKLKPYVETYERDFEELKLDNAAVDATGNLLFDEKGGYKFSKDGVKALHRQRQVLDEREIDFKIITVVNPQGLDGFLFLKDFVEGVDFKQEKEEEL